MPAKYLARYAEAEARALPAWRPPRDYQQVLVIPSYDEPANLVTQLLELAQTRNHLLIILVLNHPAQAASADSNTAASDPNQPLRERLQTLPVAAEISLPDCQLLALTATSDLLWLERPDGLPHSEGVGLARKIGCDAALAWIHAGYIHSQWIHCTDADATLPAGYFERTEHASPDTVALTHPFRHIPHAGANTAMALYELRLHYHVQGLRNAGSAYAHYSVGSCMSIAATPYARVRGMPRRAGGEDFYLLNKLAKLGAIEQAQPPPIMLSGRLSQRVPFGTGRAVAALSANAAPANAAIFYHPRSYTALGVLLAGLPQLRGEGNATAALTNLLQDHAPARDYLLEAGILDAITHCRRHSDGVAGFIRHFNQWFDGFRSLKFIHALRARGCQDLSLEQSLQHPLSPWPASVGGKNPPEILASQCRHLGWL